MFTYARKGRLFGPGRRDLNLFARTLRSLWSVRSVRSPHAGPGLHQTAWI